MRAADLKRAGALIRAAGELLEGRAEHAHGKTLEWGHGPSARAYDTQAAGGSGSDPASGPVLAGVPLAELDPASHLDHVVARAADTAAVLLELLRQLGSPADVRWCYLHRHHAGERRPAKRTVKLDGVPVIACDFCYRRALRLGRPPTPEEVRANAQGRRLKDQA